MGNDPLTGQAFLHQLIQPDWRIALAVAALFGLLTGLARLLTVSGAIAACVVGFVVFGLGGGLFAVPLLAFFFTSSLLSRIGRKLKAQGGGRAAKGATRDAWQVMANGGVATILVLIYWLEVHRWPVENSRMILMLYLAALASVNADTWATEIGGLSRRAPRLLSNWKPAPPGASGAVTLLGLGAALAGSLVITLAGCGIPDHWVWHLTVPEFLAVCWAGFLGSFIDSLLGAGVQALYRDPQTNELTERTLIEGRKTIKIRGLAWVNNDTVNFLASVGGVLCAWALLHYGAYAF